MNKAKLTISASRGGDNDYVAVSVRDGSSKKEVDTNDLDHAKRIAEKHQRISLYVEIIDNHREAAQ